jgi:hypothetical protein
MSIRRFIYLRGINMETKLSTKELETVLEILTEIYKKIKQKEK